MKKPQILIDAQNQWPEDEASIQCDDLRKWNEVYPDEAKENLACFRKDCARMETFFAREKDSVDLIARFRATVKRLVNVDL